MSKKGENIRKRKDGRWEGRIKVGYKCDGKIKYRSIYAKKYKELKAKMQEALQVEQVHEEKNSNSDFTFSMIAYRWLEYNKLRLKGATIARYNMLLQTHIIPKLGNVKVSNLTSHIINSFLNEKSKYGRLKDNSELSNSYIRCIATVISSIIIFGVKNGLFDPLRITICKPTVIKKDLIIMNVETQKKLEDFILNNLTPTNVGIYIALYTGMRIGEICALNWKDIDLHSGIIYVRHTISRVKCKDVYGIERNTLILDSPKTKSSKRKIPISSALFQVIYNFKSISTSPYITSSNNSFTIPRTFETRFHRTLKQCSVGKFNFHSLRHTFATRCIEAGVDIKTLSEILGHSNASITLNTYVHSSMEMKKKQIEKLTHFIR